jgi:hypothetical protein
MGVPLGFSGDWLLIVLVSSSIWIADELFKLMGVYRMAEKKGQYSPDPPGADNSHRFPG